MLLEEDKHPKIETVNIQDYFDPIVYAQNWLAFDRDDVPDILIIVVRVSDD